MINIETLRLHILSLPFVTEDMPFGDSTLVFRIGNKMFALIGLDRLPHGVNLKCDPQRALELREQYEDITPGYHMNKQHWNTIVIEGQVPWTVMKELVQHSYDLIWNSLSKKQREMIDQSPK